MESGKASRAPVDTLREPSFHSGKIDLVGRNRDDKVVNPFVFLEGKEVAASGDKQFDQKPCSPLVSIDEAMVPTMLSSKAAALAVMLRW